MPSYIRGTYIHRLHTHLDYIHAYVHAFLQTYVHTYIDYIHAYGQTNKPTRRQEHRQAYVCDENNVSVFGFAIYRCSALKSTL
jgi:hypothetical protein